MQEELDIVDRYLEGTLSEGEQVAFEERLIHEEPLRLQVEEMRLIRQGILQASYKEAMNSLKELESTLPPIEKPIIPLWRNTWLQIAASIALVAISSYLLWPQGEEPEQLFVSYFEPYPNVIMPTVRGAEQNDSTTKALAYKAYDQQDYAEAIRLFETLEQKDEATLLYLGNSYLAMGQPKSALPLLEKVLKEFDVFDEQAEWYLAISYLKLEERDKAKETLQKVIARESSYKAKAELILKKLN